MAIDGNINPTNPIFWQNLSAEQIYNAADRRTKSVEALKSVIVWAFGIFSVGGFALSLFGALKDFDQNALISFGIAFFLLTLGYYIATVAQFPAVEKFRLGDVVEMTKAFNKTIKSQAVKFQVASAITGLGLFFLACGLLFEFSTVKANAKKSVATACTKDPVIKTGIEKKGDTTYVPTTIQWQKSKPIQISFIKLKITKGNSVVEETPLFNQVFYTDTTGSLFHSFSVLKKDSVKTLLVRVTITDKTSSDTSVQRISTIKLSLPE